MKIQTMSVVVGADACNAGCPFCVSKMTPKVGLVKASDIKWRNLEKASRICRQCGVTTALLTGKGEPTLYPDLIRAYLLELEDDFPIIELQTNGLLLQVQPLNLREWYAHGLTTVSISIVSPIDELNSEVYTERYPSLVTSIELLHDIGLSVRLSVIAMKPYMYTIEQLENLLAFARKHDVEHLTVRPISWPAEAENPEIFKWAFSRNITEPREVMGKVGMEADLSYWEEMESHITDNGTALMALRHGGMVYDVGGQNICMANCLTINPFEEELRQLIFFPDGHLRYDWQYRGATLL